MSGLVCRPRAMTGSTRTSYMASIPTNGNSMAAIAAMLHIYLGVTIWKPAQERPSYSVT